MNQNYSNSIINNNQNINQKRYHYFFSHQKTNFLYCCSWKAIRSLIKITLQKYENIELYSKKDSSPIIVILDNQDINIDIHIITSNMSNYLNTITKAQNDIINTFKDILEIKPNQINFILDKK